MFFAWTGKRLHIHLVVSRFVRRVDDPTAIRRKIDVALIERGWRKPAGLTLQFGIPHGTDKNLPDTADGIQVCQPLFVPGKRCWNSRCAFQHPLRYIVPIQQRRENPSVAPEPGKPDTPAIQREQRPTAVGGRGNPRGCTRRELIHPEIARSAAIVRRSLVSSASDPSAGICGQPAALWKSPLVQSLPTADPA